MNSKEKVLIHKGIDRVKQGKLEEALKYCEKVLAMNPDNTDAWNNKGVTMFQMGKLEEALDCANCALEIEPDNLEALRNKGFILKAMERFEEALECYDKVVTAGGELSDIESKALILVGIGRIQDAVDQILAAIRTAPAPSMRLEEDLQVLLSIQKQNQGEQSPGEG